MAITALTLLGTFFYGLLENTETQLAPAISCLTLKSKLISSCYSENKVEIEISRAISDDEITSFRFIIGSPGKEESIYCGEGCGSCTIPQLGQTKKFYFNLDYSPERITLFANDNCNLGTKEVKPC